MVEELKEILKLQDKLHKSLSELYSTIVKLNLDDDEEYNKYTDEWMRGFSYVDYELYATSIRLHGERYSCGGEYDQHYITIPLDKLDCSDQGISYLVEQRQLRLDALKKKEEEEKRKKEEDREQSRRKLYESLKKEFEG